MTVKELIAKLLECPMDAQVKSFTGDDYSSYWQSIDDVEIERLSLGRDLGTLEEVRLS